MKISNPGRSRPTNMQNGPFRSGRYLDLKSKNGLSRSTCNSFDASRREEQDAVKSNVVALLSQKLLPEKNRESVFFLVFALWRPNRYIEVKSEKNIQKGL